MKICVITGGGGGMGTECAKIMGKREKLLLVDISQEKLDAAVEMLAGLGITDVETAICNVGDREAVKELAEKAASLGEIGSVIHTAGAPHELPAEIIINVNCVGVYNMIEEFYKVMGEGSNMVTVSSLSTWLCLPAFQNEAMKAVLDDPDDPAFEAKMVGIAKNMAARSGGPEGGLAYSVGKVFSYVYSQRNVQRFADKGIRINSVTPGVVATAMGDNEGARRQLQQMAIKRSGTPEEMAHVICFLTDDLCGDVTGIDISMDGGWSALRNYPNQVE